MAETEKPGRIYQIQLESNGPMALWDLLDLLDSLGLVKNGLIRITRIREKDGGLDL